jgi:hypothetical protein
MDIDEPRGNGQAVSVDNQFSRLLELFPDGGYFIPLQSNVSTKSFASRTVKYLPALDQDRVHRKAPFYMSLPIH